MNFIKLQIFLFFLFATNSPFSYSMNEESISQHDEVLNEKIILYIYLLDLDDKMNDPDKSFFYFRKELLGFCPGCVVRKVAATDCLDLKDQLDQVLKKNEIISHLYIRGHGYSFDKTNKNNKIFISSGIQVGKSEILDFFYYADHNFQIPLSENSDKTLIEMNRGSINVFSGIRGKFSSNTRILITSCDLLKGTFEEAQWKAQGIAYVLGLDNAFLYANKVKGFTPTKPLIEYLNHPEEIMNDPNEKEIFERPFFQNSLEIPEIELFISQEESRLLQSSNLSLKYPSLSLIEKFGVFLYLRNVNRAVGTNEGYLVNVSKGKIDINPISREKFEKDYFQINE